ncbi:hypothetical protein O6P43_013845 [Quillaja saponaria]|uniref:Uncharacterized protein n=1 Tax=Quillaja saponaria TaxID=32244 RepID=A0AAD7LTB8_QUISA|nr:hypothetical protein O6P43_013845 [Quillaja saponaria]
MLVTLAQGHEIFFSAFSSSFPKVPPPLLFLLLETLGLLGVNYLLHQLKLVSFLSFFALVPFGKAWTASPACSFVTVFSFLSPVFVFLRFSCS